MWIMLFSSKGLVVQRPDLTTDNAVFSMGFITGMFNIILSGICSFNSTSEYRYLIDSITYGATGFDRAFEYNHFSLSHLEYLAA